MRRRVEEDFLARHAAAIAAVKVKSSTSDSAAGPGRRRSRGTRHRLRAHVASKRIERRRRLRIFGGHIERPRLGLRCARKMRSTTWMWFSVRMTHAAVRRCGGGSVATGRAAPNRPTTWQRTADFGGSGHGDGLVGWICEVVWLLVVSSPALKKLHARALVQVEMAVDTRVLAGYGNGPDRPWGSGAASSSSSSSNSSGVIARPTRRRPGSLSIIAAA